MIVDNTRDRNRSGYASRSRSSIVFGKTISGGGGNAAPPLITFNLEMLDLGAGAVSTVPTFAYGSPTATYTRATVAWTKLASGLWASVASGTARSCYFGATTAVGAYCGYFIEGPATQLTTPDASIRDMTDASWVKGATITAAKTATGIDGAANSCTTLTGGAVSATNTAFQTLTAAASSRTYSVWLKRRTGTGTINITQDGGSTYTDITSQINGSTFTRVSLTASVLNAAFGIQVVTSTDAVDVDFNQFEAGSFATSPMATAGAARAADQLSYTLTNNISGGNGACYVEITGTQSATSSGLGIICCGVGRPLFDRLATSTNVSIGDGTSNLDKSALASIFTATRKRASSWGGANMSVTGDGAAPATAAFDGNISATTTIDVGTIAGGSWLYGMLKNIRIYSLTLSDAQIQTLTT